MYLNQEALYTDHPAAAKMRSSMPLDAEIQAAIVRGSKMRSEAFWNLLSGAARFVGRVIAGFRAYRQKQKAIDALRQMDRRLLADIGLTPGDVERAVVTGREHVSNAEATVAFKTRAAANDAAASREAA